MPIIKVNGVLLYFSHIPKCGGSSVENLLAQFSDSIVFLDRKFLTHKNTWNTSSPQHIDGLSLNRLFKDKSLAFFGTRHGGTENTPLCNRSARLSR